MLLDSGKREVACCAHHELTLPFWARACKPGAFQRPYRPFNHRVPHGGLPGESDATITRIRLRALCFLYIADALARCCAFSAPADERPQLKMTASPLTARTIWTLLTASAMSGSYHRAPGSLPHDLESLTGLRSRTLTSWRGSGYRTICALFVCPNDIKRPGRAQFAALAQRRAQLVPAT